MSLKFHIYATYANYFMCSCQATISLYITHMSSMQSTVQPGMLLHICVTFTHVCMYVLYVLTKYVCHITHICPTALILYSTCRFHITAQTSQKSINCNLIYDAITIYVSTTNMPLKCHIYDTYANYFMCTYETNGCIYTS